jgi:hypothetical protein
LYCWGLRNGQRRDEPRNTYVDKASDAKVKVKARGGKAKAKGLTLKAKAKKFWSLGQGQGLTSLQNCPLYADLHHNKQEKKDERVQWICSDFSLWQTIQPSPDSNREIASDICLTLT